MDPPDSQTGKRSSACAYLITFSCYGKWLPGQPGAIDRYHHVFGAPAMPVSPALEQHAAESMRQQPVVLGEALRRATRSAILEVCEYRQWSAIAVHVRTDHIHVVVRGDSDPETIMVTFKRYASRALNRLCGPGGERRWWGRHGSTRYLLTAEEVTAAVRYVLEGQGSPMARWFIDA